MTKHKSRSCKAIGKNLPPRVVTAMELENVHIDMSQHTYMGVAKEGEVSLGPHASTCLDCSHFLRCLDEISIRDNGGILFKL